MKCLAYLLVGINATDITKLKSSGFYTVAVKMLLLCVTHSTGDD